MCLAAAAAVACGGVEDGPDADRSEASAEVGDTVRGAQGGDERVPGPRGSEPSGPRFRAVGNEPGWHLTVAADRLVLATDYGERRLNFPLPEPAAGASADSTVYRSEADGHRVAILIIDEPCQDSMSGERFPATVIVRLDEQTLPGCGGPVR